MQRRRSRSGRVKTVSWREDPEIQARLRLIEQWWNQPVHRALDLVNRQLIASGKPPISEDQFYTDKAHVRERYHEEHPDGLEAHVTRNLMRQAAVERDLAQVPPAQRAALHAVLIRYEEDLMKITGIWGAQREAAGIQVDESSLGPSPRELLERGVIDRIQYREYVAILAHSSGGQRIDGPAGGLAAAIEGQVEEIEPPPPPTVSGPRLRRGAHSDPIPGMPRSGDELLRPRVVPWPADEEEIENP